MFLSLTITCIIAGAVLAAVSNVTKEPIAAAKKSKLEDAIREVIPSFDNSPSDEAYMAAVSAGDSLKIYPAKKNGKLTGVAVESNTEKGFSGEIKVIVGLDTSGKLINYKVLEHAETPGLGSKMEEWFRSEKNNRNILGKNHSKHLLKVKKDGGDIDAITAATISSRAFLDAVNRAYAAFFGKEDHSDATSGATNSQTSSNDESPPEVTSENRNQPDTVIHHNEWMEIDRPKDTPEKAVVFQHAAKEETKRSDSIPEQRFISKDTLILIPNKAIPSIRVEVDSIHTEEPEIESKDTLSSPHEATDETSPAMIQPDTTTTQKGGKQ
jgi:electron transport complex protein RnfG